jgi:hypothetical protein
MLGSDRIGCVAVPNRKGRPKPPKLPYGGRRTETPETCERICDAYRMPLFGGPPSDCTIDYQTRNRAFRTR